MKIVFNKQVLMEALSAASGSVSTKSTQNAVEGFLIESDGNDKCTIVSYDTEKGMRIQIPAKVEEAGSCIIKSDLLINMVRVLYGDVTLEVNSKGVAKVTCGGTYYELHSFPGEQFPSIPELRIDDGFTINQGELKKMIVSTMFAVGSGDVRPELNGEFFHIKDGEITLVSCDSNRLAIKTKKCDMKGLGDTEHKFIIPVKSLGELVKHLSDDGYVIVRPGRKHVVFKIGEKYFITKLIDREYVDYMRFIPKESNISVIINRNDFLDSLQRALVATDDRESAKTKPPVRCHFENDVVYLSVRSIVGSFSEELKTKQEGNAIVIGFNCKFLVDAISACDVEEIKLSMTSPLMTMIVRAAEEKEGDSFTYLVLPTKLKD